MSWRVTMAALVFCFGCVEEGGAVPEDSIRSSFNHSYSCPEELVEIRQLDPARFEATGCQHTRRYLCPAAWCRPDGEDEAENNNHLLWSTINFTNKWLTFKADPNKGETVRVAFGATDSPKADCQLQAMIDGELLDLPHEAKQPLVLRLSRDEVRDFGLAKQVGFGTCDDHWSLSTAQLATLRDFVSRYETEMGWKGNARSGPSGGRTPPAGGWPAWHALGALPSAQAGEALPPTQLFEKLKPSVLRVEATLDTGFAQGSAVAVTPGLLVTNCHVVAGAAKVLVKQGKTEWRAHVVQSDPKADRCVLEVTPANLTPLTGVRAYSDLKVGEALFTLGMPSGLDLSISDGLLSGLREEEGVRYVQTTAPISPGSSGGGLFDGRGNLVGITTLIFVGKHQLNQSLNFAIAADSFWSP